MAATVSEIKSNIFTVFHTQERRWKTEFDKFMADMRAKGTLKSGHTLNWLHSFTPNLCYVAVESALKEVERAAFTDKADIQEVFKEIQDRFDEFLKSGQEAATSSPEASLFNGDGVALNGALKNAQNAVSTIKASIQSKLVELTKDK